ncbi:MAG TPA: type II toxin-antitoxin system VapC family toxin [Anaerolineae bacterium]|nr:type II toxin-antitoxin system VapC family toxin [Anaerolineae bacterium]
MRQLLDTDTFSYVLNGREPIATRARAYVEEAGRFSISLITFYEALRGLKFSQAAAKLERFERFAQTNEIIVLDISICRVAADLHATLRRRGQLLPDADLLIAATALARGYTLVTRNTGHFERVPNLQLENWAS